MLSGTRANIAVKIFGDDLATLRQLAGQVQSEMSQVEGVVDLATEAQTDIPTLKVRVDPAAAARHGLESGTVAGALQTARVGHTVGQILEGQIAFPLVVRYAIDESSALDSLATTEIQTPDRRQVPLSAVATIQEDRGPNFVMRENVQRRIVVQSNVSGRDLRSVVNDIQERVDQNVRLPQGYRIEYGGQFESEVQASRQLLWLSFGVVIAGCLNRRLHYVVRHRHPQRHHAGVAHPSSAGTRGRYRFQERRDSRRDRAARTDFDDGPGSGARARTDRAVGRRTRQ
jgi:Cu/Ag efflux pump CusA